MNPLRCGLDVGSTTVKAVVLDAHERVVWSDYQRHNTRQGELVRAFLVRIGAATGGRALELFVTGSGSRALIAPLNAHYVQEVNAVTWAVEQRHPRAGSVVELGGQDAKVIFWRQDARGGRSTKASMNDKCAGGTGATLDKIFGKIGLTMEEAARVHLEGRTIHRVAAKCGVFAETDVVGLLKAGVDREEILVSLCNAVVRQNLEVLVRGNVLCDEVLLLGGPHTYLPVLAELWRQHIPETWRAHGWRPAGRPLEELIHVPEEAQYYAALGAVLFGSQQSRLVRELQPGGAEERRLFSGLGPLDDYLGRGRAEQLSRSGVVREALVSSTEELEAFRAAYSIPPFAPKLPAPGSLVPCVLGIDGGSTSSKLVLLDGDGEPFYKDYVLSAGNPIEDVRAMFQRLGAWATARELTLDLQASAVTGYASAILEEAFDLDLAVVETVAHMRGAVRDYGDVDVICDVGGQDIKVLLLRGGRVVDFMLNTQCSAGNGYFLQGMAAQFDIPVERYAEHAFQARQAPAFNYGCAVFMEQDKVNFQQQGWSKDEIMAGLAIVLPLNIWNYVVQDTNIARFGRRVVLQGGTQKNLAAVKAQVDFIQRKSPETEVVIHRHTDIVGAIGAALEAQRVHRGASRFIGIAAAAQVAFEAMSDESTRCRFCPNHCPRAFIDIQVTQTRRVRFISGNACERGKAGSAEALQAWRLKHGRAKAETPNLVEEAAERAFAEVPFEPLPEEGARVAPGPAWTFFASLGQRIPGLGGRARPFSRSSPEAARRRAAMVVGMPRLLNAYLVQPFFTAYLACLGVGRVVFGPVTSPKLWAEGSKWGAIDPCFPAKVAPAHIYHLLQEKERLGLTHICFPRVTQLPSTVEDACENHACVIQMGTPEVVHAVFTRERDFFAEREVGYWKPLVNLARPPEARDLLFDYFGEPLGITEDENAWAVRQGFAALSAYLDGMRARGRAVIEGLVREGRLGLLLIGHPYHNDPGLNHGIPEQFQLRGFPVLGVESLPVDDDFLAPLFPEPGGAHRVGHVWSRNFNRNLNHKLWGALVASRHPNLAVLDLSSFKCGFDAPAYSYVANILDATGTPHFLFHDIDQNKPGATFGIRVQTIDYFLRLEQEALRRQRVRP
ncbi:MAG: BadF/BadG/BcrA/BcrD ATPase family protein [Pseudomonadota bacterium]